MVSKAEALLEARQSNRTRALVHRLLSAMCDCMVHLDSELRIVEPCPKLSSLLLRSSATSPLLAQSFLQFMPPDEHERFIQHIRNEELQQASSCGNAAAADLLAFSLHLNLVDANGVLVPIEIFSSFVRDIDGTAFHLVGIKEDVGISSPMLAAQPPPKSIVVLICFNK